MIKCWHKKKSDESKGGKEHDDLLRGLLFCSRPTSQTTLEKRRALHYEIKSGKERRAGNWEISGINQFQSGAPFSVQSGDDFAGVGPGSGAQFWNQVASEEVARIPFINSATWFNRNAFAQPAAGTFGVQQRNALRNPGFWNWDVGIRKNFPVRAEIQRLHIRLEIFNLLNHPNWGGANANPKSGTFGEVTSKSGQRQLQLALKYIF
jgi:hypothetical protein